MFIHDVQKNLYLIFIESKFFFRQKIYKSYIKLISDLID